MISHKRPLRTLLALALACSAIAPPAASARPPSPDPPQPKSQRPVELVRVSGDRGFEWADAGIGAAGALGLSLLAGGGVLIAQRRGRSMRAAS